MWHQRPNCWSTLGSKMNKSSSLWSFSKKNFHWFRISLHVLVSLSYFRWVLKIGIRGPIFRVILRPKIDHISGFQAFSQLFHWFHIILVLHAYWGTVMCISMIYPKGFISGPRVKVAAELVMSPGFLFNTLLLLKYLYIHANTTFQLLNIFCHLFSFFCVVANMKCIAEN